MEETFGLFLHGWPGSSCGSRARGCSPRSIAVCPEVTLVVPVSPCVSHSREGLVG